MDEGIDLYQLEPKTWNPVENWLTKLSEMRRFNMAHEIKNDYLDRGLVVEVGKAEVPKGWVRLNDQLFNGKQFMAPADLAKDFNKYFSPGLIGNPLYDAVLV